MLQNEIIKKSHFRVPKCFGDLKNKKIIKNYKKFIKYFDKKIIIYKKNKFIWFIKILNINL